MPAEITMPQLSDTMTEGTLVKWLKKEGDKVKAGDIIAEVETDKATMEMETFEGGTLAFLVVKEGGKVAVGATVAVIATSKENPAEVKAKFSSAKTSAPVAASATAVAQTVASTPAVAHASVAVASSVTTSVVSQVTESRIKASPLARRVAADRGIAIEEIPGSGPNGRIIQSDVMGYQPAAKASASNGTPPIPAGEKQVIPMSKMRTAIATALQKSKQQIPHFYASVDIDMEELSKLRERMNVRLEKEKVRLSIADFITKAVCYALAKHPVLNARFNSEKNEIVRYSDVNLGIAVSVPDGLIVPVLRAVNRMGLKDIRSRSSDLIDRARGQKLRREEQTEGTFTISSLGTMGVKEFNAIINPPEVGILAIGAAEKRAVVRDGSIVARSTMTVTLSADHRAVDGATAAEFLATLKSVMEEPGLMLA